MEWNVRTARDNESVHALPLIDVARARGFAVETCAMDKGQHLSIVYEGCDDSNVRLIIPLGRGRTGCPGPPAFPPT